MHPPAQDVNLKSPKVLVSLIIPRRLRAAGLSLKAVFFLQNCEKNGNSSTDVEHLGIFRVPRQASCLAGHSSFLHKERKEPIQQQEHLSAHNQNSVQIHQPPATGLKQPVTGEQNDQQQSENPGAG